MSLFDRVINYVKSAGHAMEGEEHKLLNEFVAYLASEKVALGFSKSPVVASFAASLIPAPEPVQVAPVAEVTPVEAAPVEAPASVTINVEDPASATIEITAPVDPEQNVAS